MKKPANGIQAIDIPTASVARRAAHDGAFGVGGVFTVECRGPDGKLKWAEDAKNLVTNEGLNHALNIVLHGDTPITTWYFAIVETNTTPAAGLTYAVPTYTECTAYDEATRQAWTEGAASSQSITNGTAVTLTMNATKTIYGAALVGGGSAPTTKGDAAGGGTLFAYGLFAASKSVADDDTLNLTYTVNASSS